MLGSCLLILSYTVYILKTDWECLLSNAVHQFFFFFLFLPKNLLVSNSLIRHLHISHNTPPHPCRKKKKSIIIVFSFSWRNRNTQKKLTAMVMQNFWGAQNVYYGRCANWCQIVISFLVVSISVMAATVLWQISSVLLHCICEVVILRVHCCRLGSRCVELFETWHVSCHCPQALSHLQLQTA